MKSDINTQPCLLEAARHLEKLKPDQFELYFERSAKTKIDAKDGEVDSLTRSEDMGLAIRLIKDGKLGFSFTTSMEKDAVKKAVETAFSIAKIMPVDKNTCFQSFLPQYPEISAFDPVGLKSPIDEKIAMAKELESLCKKADSRVKGVRSASLNESEHETQMMDSQGKTISHCQTLFSASITCKAEQDGDSQIGSEFGFSNALSKLDVPNVARLAAKWATELLGSGQAPTLFCPAVFRNSVVAELVEFISASFSAEELDKGRSMLAGKEGVKIFSEKVSLIDDGLMAGGYGTAPFDGEGTPAQKTVVAENGVIQRFLYDLYYAKKLSKKSTGNSGRGIKSPPSIGVSNFYLEGGKNSPESLLDGISKGILITDLMGLHTANPVTGDFSLGASGILIENGKLTRPVRGFAVAGNILDVFRKITDVGSDLRFFGSIGAPSVRISDISVGGV